MANKITIYMYSFFDREDMFFHNIVELNKADADREAWEYFSNALHSYEDDDQTVETCTASSLEEFTSKDYNYIDLADIGGLECQYETMEL